MLRTRRTHSGPERPATHQGTRFSQGMECRVSCPSEIDRHYSLNVLIAAAPIPKFANICDQSFKFLTNALPKVSKSN